ncbi:MAG: TatD family hydrolase [Gemmatimonadota bacterium]
MLFDSHCHLTDERFAGDLEEVLRRAWDAGLTGLVTVASGADDAVAALAVAALDSRIRSTAGVHPHAAADAQPDDMARIRTLVLEEEAVVAIGETGLDFHYDNSPRAAQTHLFEEHLRLAQDTGYPVIVHSRSADRDTAALIRSAPGVTGVLHCFAGGRHLLDTALDSGWFISFAGLATFRNFDNVALLVAVPAERLLLETDSPYLAPVPHRGKRNEPAFVAETCAVVARLRGEDPVRTAAQTTANAHRFYRIGPEVPA